MAVGVTDHAVLRYLERVKGFDVEAVRQHIAGLCKGVQTARCVRAENVDFVIQYGVVVTVKPHGALNPRRVPRPKADWVAT
jgi:hypothetical protein